MLKNFRYGLVLIGSLFPLLTHAAIVLPIELSPTAVLAATTVTNAGASTVRGDVDVSPGTAITGFPPGTIINGQERTGPVAARAHTQAQNYYNTLIAQPCPSGNNLTGQDLGGKTLAPGVYCFSSDATLNGTLTLSGAKGSVYIFQIGSTLTTGVSSRVRLRGGVQAIDVNWAIGSSAVVGNNTNFAGNILAVTSITVSSGANVSGRALAINAAVTLDTNYISVYK